MKNNFTGWIIYDAASNQFLGKDGWTKNEPRIYVVASHAEWQINQIKRRHERRVYSWQKVVDLHVYPCTIEVDLLDGRLVDLNSKSKYSILE